MAADFIRLGRLRRSVNNLYGAGFTKKVLKILDRSKETLFE